MKYWDNGGRQWAIWPVLYVENLNVTCGVRGYRLVLLFGQWSWYWDYIF